jgi:signal transduction histidine kinase/PAS domain-containing protein
MRRQIGWRKRAFDVAGAAGGLIAPSRGRLKWWLYNPSRGGSMSLDTLEDAVSVQLLRSVFDRAPFGVALYDPDLRFIDVNEAFAAMGGRPRADHQGRLIEDVLPRLAGAITPHLRSVFATGRAVLDVELHGFRHPTSVRAGHWRVTYEPIASGETVVAVAAIVTHIAAPDRASALLDMQREVLSLCAMGEPLTTMLDRITKAIEEHSLDGAIPSILLVEDGRLRHGSAPGLPPEYTGAIDGTVIGPRTGSCGTAAYRREPVYVTDIEIDPLWIDYRRVAREAGLRSCWSVPIIGTSGDVIGTFALYHREPRQPSKDDQDLIALMSQTTAVLIEWRRGEDNRRRMLEAEHNARQAAETANRSKDEFVANLSHELRTPLNAILGWASILRRPELEAATASRGLDAIERNATAQARLIDDLLDTARIVSGKMQLKMEMLDLNSVVEASLDSVRPLAAGKRVELTPVPGPPGTMVAGDETRMRQILWNLLSNAIKFTPSGGSVRLEVTQQKDGSHVVVSDTGAGIPAELLPHVFDRYRQGRDRAAGGLGLGLAIAHHVAELHGGTLRATSAGLGQGARFELVLPPPSSSNSPV